MDNQRENENNNIWEKERERRSSFVVDLRSASKSKEELKSEAKKIERQAVNFINQAEKKTRRILKREKRKAERRLASWPKIKVSMELSDRPSIFSKKNPWPRLVKQKRRAFLAPVKAALIKEQRRRQRVAQGSLAWRRPLFSFLLILILIIIPLKLLSYFPLLNWRSLEDRIMNHSQAAVGDLITAAQKASSFNFRGADNEFRSAGANFLAAQKDLASINDAVLSLAALTGNPKLKLAAESRKFLTAGALAASLGRNLVLATDSLFSGDRSDFQATLQEFLTYGRQASEDAKNLQSSLGEVNINNLPEEYRAKFSSLESQAGVLADNLDNFVSAAERLQKILGFSRDQRYLLVFQNNRELRASGGFLGSYALLDLSRGKIRNLEVPGGGSYDTEAGLRVSVVAPEPLWLVNPLWHFWDANWWPDWPTTAKNLMWFYYKSGGPSVDGVISLTPTVVEDLLRITGPISLPEYGLIIDADNFWPTVQTIVEAKNLAKTNPSLVTGLPTTTAPIAASLPLKQDLENNKDNKPKKIIGDLMAKILEVLPQKLNQENFLGILSLLQDNLSQKQILFYFNDPVLQNEVVSRNWGGAIAAADRDYLLVVDTNIAGQKSDAKMQEKIELDSQVAVDGTITNTLRISRAHTGIKNEPMTGVRNVDWLRIYVPRGSVLLSNSGWRRPDDKYLNQRPDPGWQRNPFLIEEEAATVDPVTGLKIYTENGKTVFANWLMVDPGETGLITITYRLPFNFFDEKKEQSGWLERLNSFLNPDAPQAYRHSLLVQKQPGARPADLVARLALPAGYQTFWRYPDNLATGGGWLIQEPLSGDKYWSILTSSNRERK